MLVQDVWLDKDTASGTVQIRIHWKTGAVTEGWIELRPAGAVAFRTPPATVETVRRLVAEAKEYKAIAVQLNEEGVRTGMGNEFTGTRVRGLVQRYKLRSGVDGGPCNHPSQKS
jgi:hypothetical protein